MRISVPGGSSVNAFQVPVCECIVAQLERKRMVSEYKALREKEEEEQRLEEIEKQKAEAAEKRLMSAELTAKYRDRVWHCLNI